MVPILNDGNKNKTYEILYRCYPLLHPVRYLLAFCYCHSFPFSTHLANPSPVEDIRVCCGGCTETDPGIIPASHQNGKIYLTVDIYNCLQWSTKIKAGNR